MNISTRRTSLLLLGLLPGLLIAQQNASPYRGLWVGQAKIDAVNEVSVPLDASNQPIAPDPEKPTPTADAAFLRVLLHVNGAGQAYLLKDVAILNRSESAGDPGMLDAATMLPNSDSDFVLITDPALYDEVPPQPAVRFASSVFDFGDSRATERVDELVEVVADAIAANIQSDGGDLNNDGERVALRDAQRIVGEEALAPLIAGADVAQTFASFIATNFTSQVLDEIAALTNDGSSHLTVAQSLQDKSSYDDARMVDMVNAAVAAANAGGSNVEARVHNVASSYADVGNEYGRFIAGSTFGDMVEAAAQAAAQTAVLSGEVDEDDLRDAVNADSAVDAAEALAFQSKVAAYKDTRSQEAFDTVIDAVIAVVVSNLPATNLDAVVLANLAERAGWDAHADLVSRYPVPQDVPSTDYNEFVALDLFQTAAETAAAGAVDAAISEKRNNGLFTLQSIHDAARLGATDALRDLYAAAARAKRTELPLDGTLAPGSGDPRSEGGIGVSDAPLGAAGLAGTIYLPANHPTNPFRHRRHPDHTTGMDILRHIRFDFDAMPDGPAKVGYGVDRLTGRYREELLGLHKALGPNPDTNPIGLKVEGSLELNRVSLLDALNSL